MTKFLSVVTCVATMALAAAAIGQEPSPVKESEAKATKATFLITGLHCPPCTRTVESSLGKAKGVRTIKVDWKTKSARIEFDEKALTAQQLARLIAATPQMMGGNMHYAGWLALKAPEIKDEASAKRAQEVLKKVEGVNRVIAYPAQHSLVVSFTAKGNLTTRALIDKLNEAGFQAKAS